MQRYLPSAGLDLLFAGPGGRGSARHAVGIGTSDHVPKGAQGCRGTGDSAWGSL